MPVWLVCIPALCCLLFAGCDKSDSEPVLYIGLMVHLEGWNLREDAAYDSYKEKILALADIFDEYGAALTLELKEPVTACEIRGDYYFKQLEERGHGIGVHADAGGTAKPGETWQDMSLSMASMKNTLEKQGVTVRHVSGYCSPLDWVRAVLEAGYSFVTGGVTYCLLSLPQEEIPEPYSDCETPAECHDPYPLTIEDRIHAWTIKKGEPWIEDRKAGELVYIAAATDGLPYLSGEDSGAPEFTGDDVDVYLEKLEYALNHLDSEQPNFFYVGWSFGTEMPESFARQWLGAIQQYADEGRVQWKTIPEMYDIYVEWRDS